MSTLLVLLLPLIVASLLSLTHSAGLQEDFTWTRISYNLPPGTENRFGGARYYRPPQRPSYGGGGGAKPPPGNGGIAFPQDDGETEIKPGAGEDVDTGGEIPTEGYYIYENNIPMGAGRYRNKMFVTVPRRRNGVPSTLNYVPYNSKTRHNAPLIPYPDLETNNLDKPTSPGAERLCSIYRIKTDACDRLWAVDTGIMELPNNRTRIQPQSIVIIDLKTDKIIHRYNLKESDATSQSHAFADITVDVTANNCDDAFAYIPDLAGYGLIVYSLKADDSWRVTHNYFFLEPTGGNLNIGGHQFQWTDGIFSAALTDIQRDGFRDMYFQPMAGYNLYKVSTRILRDRALATRDFHGEDFMLVGNRGNNSQTSSTDLHRPTGVLFLNYVNQNALACYNTNRAFNPADVDIVQRDDQKMIYPCDVQVAEDDVYLLTNTMPTFLYGRLDYNQINFRIWKSGVLDAVRGTRCASRGAGSSGNSGGGGYRG